MASREMSLVFIIPKMGNLVEYGKHIWEYLDESYFKEHVAGVLEETS